MTFYDSFFPSFDYNPYQQASYGRRTHPTRGMNPYASMSQPQYVYDPYHRIPKQQPRHFPYQQKVRNPYGYPSYYQEDEEEEQEEQEIDKEEYPRIQHPHASHKSPQSRSPDRETVQRGARKESDGIHIPIRRAQPVFQKQQPQVNKEQSNSSKAQNGKKKAKDDQADKVAVDRSVLEHKEEDPLIIELPIDQIPFFPSTYESDTSYQPGKVEYIWEDEDNDDVIETIIESPISEIHSKERLRAPSPAEMVLEEMQENIEEADNKSQPNYTEEELEVWKKELETFSFIGFNDANILIPLLREFVHHPEVVNDAKQRGLQEILRRLILH